MSTNAERQRAYRQRHLKDTDGKAEMFERINMMVPVSTKRDLQRLAFHEGITQRAMLERVITEATFRVLETLEGRDQDRFYDMQPVLRSNEGGEPQR